MNIKFLIILIILIILKCLEKNITNSLIEKHSRNVYYFKNFYPVKLKNKIKNIILKNKNHKFRLNNIVRHASSISHHQMINTYYESIIEIFRDIRTLNIIRKKTGMNLQLVPRLDPNQLSIFFYEDKGDGITWHKDSDLYEGNRWTCIYTVINEGSNNGKSHGTFRYKINNKEYSIDTESNSIILFKGNNITHKVDDIKENENRIVISLVLCDVCAMKQNLVNYFYSKIINYSFYGKLF